MNTLEKIRELLKKNNISYKEFKHEPVRTSEEAQEQRPDYTLEQGAKALIIKLRYKDRKDYAMFILPAHKRLDSKKVRSKLCCQSLSFAQSEKVVELTQGVEPGGVPPFGNLFDIDVYVDPTLGENDEIIFNAGDRSVSIAMKYRDWEEVVGPEEFRFVED